MFPVPSDWPEQAKTLLAWVSNKMK
jgi:hypothetical protein